mgnify:CR=1 FL=1
MTLLIRKFPCASSGKWRLRTNSLLAVANARTICAEHFQSCHELEIVDLVTQAARGRQQEVQPLLGIQTAHEHPNR